MMTLADIGEEIGYFRLTLKYNMRDFCLSKTQLPYVIMCNTDDMRNKTIQRKYLHSVYDIFYNKEELLSTQNEFLLIMDKRDIAIYNLIYTKLYNSISNKYGDLHRYTNGKYIVKKDEKKRWILIRKKHILSYTEVEGWFMKYVIKL